MARATKFKAQWVDTCCQHKLWHLQLNLLLFVKRKCWQKSSEAQEASTFAWENTEVTCLSLGNAILASDPCAACSSQSRCQLLRGVERLMKCSCEGAAPFKLHPHTEQSRILAQTWHSISIEYHICTFNSDTSFCSLSYLTRVNLTTSYTFTPDYLILSLFTSETFYSSFPYF